MCKWRFIQWMTFGLVLGFAVALGAWAQTATGASGTATLVINDQDTIVLPGNTYPRALPQFDVGPVDPAQPMKNMILSLKVSPDKQAQLDRLLAEQQDPKSPNFHKWLTPQEFGTRFGPSQQELDAITAWLKSKNFVIEKVANGRLSINFSGTAADVEKAFHTQMRHYLVEGKTYSANTTDPSIPRALSGLVAGIVSLNNFPRKAMHTPPKPVTRAEYTDTSGNHYLAPGDFAIIYDVNPLYSSGITGSGVTIAIVARTNPNGATGDWSDFRTQFGLSGTIPNIIINPATGDPGDVPDDDGEAMLDAEWSGAVAKGATIDFVTSASGGGADGVDLSAQYIVDNQLAPVMSTSYGLCEYDLGSSGNAQYNNMWMQAAAEGISAFVSAGDNGAAGCDNPNSSSASYGLAVNGLGSTPYNVCVGGTELEDWNNIDLYWSPYTSGTGVSALQYIPEKSWNESGAAYVCPPGDSCDYLWSGSGGVSSIYSKPSWQVAYGVPTDGARDVPDVSLTSASYDGYLVEQGGQLWVYGGTSAASPSFAGLMALIVQKTGEWQGNPNPRLYQLGNAQYPGTSNGVFHDVTFGDNSVPGLTGYQCGVGYDLVTGLGSVDAYALASNWGGGGGCQTITLSPPSLPSAAPGVPYDETVTASGGTAPYTYSPAGTLPPGLNLSGGGEITGSPTAQGTYSFTITATDSHSCTGSGSYSIVVVPPPVVQFGTKMGGPFRIIFTGSNLQPGLVIYVNNSSVSWQPTIWKNTGKFVLKGGASLKAAVPQGVVTPFTVVNPDGGVQSYTWHW